MPAQPHEFLAAPQQAAWTVELGQSCRSCMAALLAGVCWCSAGRNSQGLAVGRMSMVRCWQGFPGQIFWQCSWEFAGVRRQEFAGPICSQASAGPICSLEFAWLSCWQGFSGNLDPLIDTTCQSPMNLVPLREKPCCFSRNLATLRTKLVRLTISRPFPRLFQPENRECYWYDSEQPLIRRWSWWLRCGLSE